MAMKSGMRFESQSAAAFLSISCLERLAVGIFLLLFKPMAARRSISFPVCQLFELLFTAATPRHQLNQKWRKSIYDRQEHKNDGSRSFIFLEYLEEANNCSMTVIKGNNS